MLRERATRIVAAGVGVTLAVAGVALTAGPAAATPLDTTPPTLLSVSVSPTTIDVSSSPATVTVTMTASDDVAVDDVSVELDSPDGSQYRYASTYAAQPDGTWQVPVSIPVGMQHGLWFVAYVSVYDTSSNSTTYGQYGDHPLPGAVPTVNVTDLSEDVTPPALGTAIISPSPVDVATTPQDVTVTVPVTDPKSGVDSFSLSVQYPDDTYAPVQWTDGPDVVAGGTANNETFTGTFTIPQAAQNGQWSILVSAVDAAGNWVSQTPTGGTFTVQHGTATAPSAPYTPDVYRSGPGSLEVSWSPVYDNGSAITAYNLMQSTDGGATWQAVSPSAGTMTDVQVDGLDSTKSYSFEVSATNGVGTGPSSAASSPISPLPASATVPSAPVGVSATAGNGTATVSWSPPASNGGVPVTSYRVETSTNGGLSWTNLASGLAGSPYTVTGLTNGTSYLFRVSALNALGYGSTASTSAVTPQAPGSSPPPPPPAVPNPAAAPNPILSGAAKTGKTVTALVTLPSGVTVSYQWRLTLVKHGKKKTKTVGSGAAIKVGRTWKKGKLQLIVTFSAPGQPSSVRTILVSSKLK